MGLQRGSQLAIGHKGPQRGLGAEVIGEWEVVKRAHFLARGT